MEGRATGWYKRMERRQTDEKRYQSNPDALEELDQSIEFVEKALHEKKSYGNHIGGNVYCTVAENGVCVDIRQNWKPEEEVVPTTKGICLRPSEYVRLKELLPEIGNALPELDGVVSCFLQSDHMNQLGARQSSECNPNDFCNWWL